MMKHIFAIAFSGALFLALPPVDVSRLVAWIAIMYLYVVGLAIACWVEERVERHRKRRQAARRRMKIMERRRRA